MKKILFFGLLIIQIAAFSQSDSTQSPSSRFKVFPPAKFLLGDSITFYSKEDLPKNKQIMLMAFNPECDHCQHETEEIIKHIDQFNNIQIVMATMASITDMNKFIDKYKLTQFKNIVIVRDVSYFLPSFYQFRNFPFLAFYDKKLKLISEFSGSMPVDRILKEFKK